jgi:hypothetical protein
MRRDAREDAADLPDTQSGIFLMRDLDEWNRVESTSKIRFYARRIPWLNARGAAPPWTTTGPTLPDGQRTKRRGAHDAASFAPSARNTR